MVTPSPSGWKHLLELSGHNLFGKKGVHTNIMMDTQLMLPSNFAATVSSFNVTFSVPMQRDHEELFVPVWSGRT